MRYHCRYSCRHWALLVELWFLCLVALGSCGSTTTNPNRLHDEENRERRPRPRSHRAVPELPIACRPPHHHHYPFCNASLPLERRLDDLVARLTLEEKPALITARYAPKNAIDRLGIPEYNYGSSCMHGVESKCAPRTANQSNRTNHNEGCPTSFPNPNLLGATFNRTLWKAMGTVLGLELRALWRLGTGEDNPQSLPRLGLGCWSPTLNLQRDPRWGRNLESPSEDPYMVGRYGVEFVRGLQEHPDPRHLRAAATVKHLAAYSLEGRFWDRDGHWVPPHKEGIGSSAGPTISRHNQNVRVSPYDLQTTYLPAFAATVREARPAGIMASFNRINGVPVSVSRALLTQLLRNEWGFGGAVTSDTGGLNDVRQRHKYASNWTETVRLALGAGCDIESVPAKGYSDRVDNDHTSLQNSGVRGLYLDFVPDAVRQGLLNESLLDEAVRNALRVRFRLGLFDPLDEQPFAKISPAVIQSPEHVRLAKEATAQGLVLLRNDNELLPLLDTRNHQRVTKTNNKSSNTTLTVALIGPHIDDRTTVIGNYHGEICRDDPTNKQCVPSFREGFARAFRSHNHRSEKRLRLELVSARGCPVHGTSNTSGYPAALEAAEASDVVVFVGGLDLGLEREDHDRPDVRLPEVQANLLRQLARVNPNIVLVLLHGGMVGLDAVLGVVPSVVSVGYPGRYASTVLPGALLGNLGGRGVWGKTPVTWYPDSFGDEFNVLDYDMGKPPGRTYRYYSGEPKFRFGYGLNPLTTFAVTNLTVIPTNCSSPTGSIPQANASSSSPMTLCSDLRAAVTVANTGHRAADEVVTAYSVPLDIPSSEPASKLRQQLFGFERIHLRSGQSRTVSFRVRADHTLELADAAGRPRTFPGRYTIRIGNGVDAYLERTVVVGASGRRFVGFDSRTARTRLPA